MHRSRAPRLIDDFARHLPTRTPLSFLLCRNNRPAIAPRPNCWKIKQYSRRLESVGQFVMDFTLWTSREKNKVALSWQNCSGFLRVENNLRQPVLFLPAARDWSGVCPSFPICSFPVPHGPRGKEGPDRKLGRKLRSGSRQWAYSVTWPSRARSYHHDWPKNVPRSFRVAAKTGPNIPCGLSWKSWTRRRQQCGKPRRPVEIKPEGAEGWHSTKIYGETERFATSLDIRFDTFVKHSWRILGEELATLNTF